MKCANCGAEVEGGHFCEKCGASLIREIEISRDTGEQDEALAQGNGAETVFVPDMIRTTEELPKEVSEAYEEKDKSPEVAEQPVASQQEDTEGVMQVKTTEALVLQENPEPEESPAPELAEAKPKKKKRKSVFLRKEVEEPEEEETQPKPSKKSKAKKEQPAPEEAAAAEQEKEPALPEAEVQPVVSAETAEPVVEAPVLKEEAAVEESVVVQLPVSQEETAAAAELPAAQEEAAAAAEFPAAQEEAAVQLPVSQDVAETLPVVQETILQPELTRESEDLYSQPSAPRESVPQPAAQEIPAYSEAVKEERPTKKKKKSGIGKFFAVLFLLALLGGAGYVGYRIYTDPVLRALEQLDQGNFETAMYYIGRTGNVAGQKRFTDEALKHVRDIYAKYQAGSLNYEEACRTIGKFQEGILWSNDEIREIREKMDRLEESRNAYEAALRLRDIGNYGDAILEFEKVIKEDIAYENSKLLIVECLDLCREDALTQAAIYEEAGMYEEAIAVIDKAKTLLPSDAKLDVERTLCVGKLSEMKGEAVIADAKELCGDGKDPEAYKRARAYLEEYLEENPDDLKVRQQAEKYDKAYYKGMIQAAEDHAAKKDYDNAITTLESLAADYPDDEEITGMIDHYTARKPVRLADLEAYELLGKGAGTLYFDETVEDTFENRWKNAIGVRELFSSNLDPFNNFQSIGYIVNSRYDHFHCVLAYELTENTLGNTIVEFVMDDEVIYRTKGIKKSTKPITIDLDLPEGQIFTIRFVNNKKEECADIIVAEAEFSNEGIADNDEIKVDILDEDEDEIDIVDEADEAEDEEAADGTKVKVPKDADDADDAADAKAPKEAADGNGEKAPKEAAEEEAAGGTGNGRKK